MKSNFIHIVFSIYLGLVCLISGMAFCFSFASIGENAVVYKFPELRAGYYEHYSISYDKKPELSKEERKERYQEELKRTKWYALKDVVDSIMTLVIGLIVFVFHWRMFRKALK